MAGGGKGDDSYDYAKYTDDDDARPKVKRDKSGILRQEGRRYEFDCPDCDANNPWSDGFDDGADVRCHYCGLEFNVTFLERNKLKFRAI
jgi:transcription elongation factor Elf1